MGGGRNLTHVEVPVLPDVGSLTPVAADLHPSQILGERRMHQPEPRRKSGLAFVAG